MTRAVYFYVLVFTYGNQTLVQLLTTKIVHFYDKSLKICRITNIAEIIISGYGAKSNSILVDVMEYVMEYIMRSTRT